MTEAEITNHFHSNGWRFTKNVTELVSQLKSENGLVSAYDIQAKLPNKPDVTTIYRLLEKLQILKLVHEFQGKWKWCVAPHNTTESHHFLICEQCGQAEEVFLDYETTIAEQLKQERGFHLRKVHLGFLGVCKNCC